MSKELDWKREQSTAITDDVEFNKVITDTIEMPDNTTGVTIVDSTGAGYARIVKAGGNNNLQADFIDTITNGGVLWISSLSTGQTVIGNAQTTTIRDNTTIQLPLTVSDATESTSSVTGSVKIAGGVGVAKNLYVDGSLHADFVIPLSGHIVNAIGNTNETFTALGFNVASGAGMPEHFYLPYNCTIFGVSFGVDEESAPRWASSPASTYTIRIRSNLPGSAIGQLNYEKVLTYSDFEVAESGLDDVYYNEFGLTTSITSGRYLKLSWQWDNATIPGGVGELTWTFYCRMRI